MDTSVFQQHQPKKQTPRVNDSIIESLRNLGTGVGKTVAKDVTGKIASDALSSLFGSLQQNPGEQRANANINFGNERMPVPGMRRPEIRHQEPFVAPTELHLKEQIESVRAELKALASSIKSLNTEIQKTVTEVPVDPGIYHKNFFERIRSILMHLREQVDDSRTWLSLSTNRKKKAGFWGMYKKHGTSFGLSNERSIATSAG
jgi:hypothetical protein